jgi:hypothetical protein
MAPLQYIYLSKMLDEKETICQFMDLGTGGMFSPTRDRENTGSRNGIRAYIDAAKKACVDNFSTDAIGLYGKEEQSLKATSNTAPHSTFTQGTNDTDSTTLVVDACCKFF